ncbi:hypothetical protein [Kribbella sp. NPDC023855]|uniref:SCO7613 C-terminal domain-containing membrane protein n=1 Tax=Kribbella sp. NPDC023855 TaxID=3154698 RepID=UPI0033CAFA98
MNAHPTPFKCPACQTPLHLDVHLPPPPNPLPQPTPPQPAAPPPTPPRPATAAPRPTRAAPPTYQSSLRQPAPPKPKQPRRRLSPQATLLSLGVLLLLAAGVTFLAVTWDSLSIPVQASIIATLAALALAGSVPASRHKLAGTAEALAILGTGLLAVDLYGAHALGLDPAKAVDGLAYIGLAAALVAAANLLMSRIAPTVVTYGVATIIIGQFALPFILAGQTGLALFLFGLLLQVTITVYWSAAGTKVVHLTGTICAALVFWALLITGTARIYLSLAAHYSPQARADFGDFFDGSLTALSPVLFTTLVVVLAGATGIFLLRTVPLPRALPPALGESTCTAAAAFAVAACLPQLPTAGRWLDTALATALTLTVLLMPNRTGVRAAVAWTAAGVVAMVNLLFCLLVADVVQLGLISAIAAALAVVAVWRQRMNRLAGSVTAGVAAQLAIVLMTYDGLFNLWTGGILLALVGAASITIACLVTDPPLERWLLACASAAAVLAGVFALLEGSSSLFGAALTITAAPLVAYGMRPAHRRAHLTAVLLLAVANTAFALGAGATTIEWFTLPPAAVMLAAGIYGWRDQSSWIFLGPGLLLGLVPSALIANSNDDYLRTTFVVAAAVAIILIGTRFALQAPFIIGAGILQKIALWQFLDVAPLIPRWITLATAGLILLTVGATYERRLQNAKQAARWLTALR